MFVCVASCCLLLLAARWVRYLASCDTYRSWMIIPRYTKKRPYYSPYTHLIIHSYLLVLYTTHSGSVLHSFRRERTRESIHPSYYHHHHHHLPPGTHTHQHTHQTRSFIQYLRLVQRRVPLLSIPVILRSRRIISSSPLPCTYT